jgi:acetylglutamate kinase
MELKMGHIKNSMERADILLEALPYIKRFYNKTIVIKYGGHAMVDNELKDKFAQDVVMMKYIGINPVIVHGGGPQIGTLLKKLGKESKFIQGMRVTDEVNKEIVGLINRHGGNAVGLSGKDGNLIKAEKYYLSEEKVKNTPPEIIDIGLVGKVKTINSELIVSLSQNSFIPVIAPTGIGDAGETYNINADIVAGEIAAALQAEKLLLLTDVPGVLDKNKQLINTMTNKKALKLIDDGIVEGGMFPKIKCCLKALKAGVKKTHIIDGRLKHAILLEIFTDKGIGTEIVL